MNAAAGDRIRRVCVFCGSRTGASPRYRDHAAALGARLVAEGWRLVYGGGRVGLMGALADAVLGRGGEATGVIPTGLMRRELAHRGLTELREVESMHERKAVMAALSDAFIALPGGFGTLEEIFEAVTWAQLGIHAKPCVLLNVDGFFDPLIAQLERAVAACVGGQIHGQENGGEHRRAPQKAGWVARRRCQRISSTSTISAGMKKSSFGQRAAATSARTMRTGASPKKS